MSKTHLITAQPQQTALADALVASGALTQPSIKDATKIEGCFDFIDSLVDTKQARRFVMWSVVNAFNNFIIGQLMSHIRTEKRLAQEIPDTEVDHELEYMREHMDQATLDKYNEQRAAIAAMVDEQNARFEQGFEAQVPAIDVAETMVNLRKFVADRMALLAVSARELAQPVSESIAYRLSTLPKADERKVMQLHIATKIPLDVLRKVDLKVKIAERDEMLACMHRVVELADDLVWKHDVVNEASIESTFDTLPVHTRYKLIGSVIRALKGAMDAEVKALIRFGRMDCTTNRLLIEHTLNGYVELFRTFGSDNADALVEYESRGFPLPTIDQLLADKQ